MTMNLLRAARMISAAILMICFLYAGTAVAADGPGLAGKWKMASVTPDGSTVDWTLTMKQEGDTWSATVGAGDSETPAKEVKVDGASVHMKTPYNGDFYDVDLKLDGDKLAGKWTGSSDSGATTGVRITSSTVK